MENTRDINTVSNIEIDNIQTDKIFVSDNSSSLKKVSVHDLAKAIIEQYTMPFDGGQERSIQNSLSFIADNDGAHNAIYRGKYLGSAVTAQQWQAISDGTFKDLFIGDYWTINGINWRIAAFNYWYNTGGSAEGVCKTNHVVIVPDTCIVAPNGNIGLVENGGYYYVSDGYVGTGYYSGVNNDSSANTSKATCINMVNAAFGESHLLHHIEYFSSHVPYGVPDQAIRTESTVELMDEPMVFGSYIYRFSQMNITEAGEDTPDPYQCTYSGYLQTMGCTQLPLFAFNKRLIASDYGWWLRTLANRGALCYVSKYGYNTCGVATRNDVGIRPAFGIK